MLLMNKLEGFYQLKRMGIPSVPWRPFTGIEKLDSNLLWTIRVAVQSGNDFNLPRAVGVTAEEAILKGNEFISKYSGDDLVIYYPYFIALKSGIIEIQENQTIIEAVDKDLWNLATLGHKDITIIINRNTGDISKHGNSAFLDENEITELMNYAQKIRAINRRDIFDRSSVMVEWSYAINTDINHASIGEAYLVFYECRVIAY